jgi:hypothetical protein
MNELIGRTLGQYHIVEKIGAGGMATIYRAYQPNLDRDVAIKVLPPYYATQPGFGERFAREAKAIANLQHPNILPIYDSGQEDGYTFIAMRYVEQGRTLKDVMRSRLSLTHMSALIRQIAGALDHAHQRGVIHRDVKPGNVMMDGDWALLSDFGIAKMTEDSIRLTGTGVGIGTPAYMSPEQGQGLEVDYRTDIYSLGIVLFEMLTGRIPHEAETPLATVLKRLNEPMPRPRDIKPQVPEAVETVVLKALAPEPADRFQSAGEMAQALNTAVQRLPAATPVKFQTPSAAARAQAPARSVAAGEGAPPARRIPIWIWGAAGGLALLVLLGLLFILSGDGQEGERIAAVAAETPRATSAGAPEPTQEVWPKGTTPALPPPTATQEDIPTPLSPTATSAPTSTSLAPTDTASPSDTAEPTATITTSPEPILVYQPVPMDAYTNGSSDFLSPPVGSVTLGGVPFQLSDRLFKSQAAPSPNSGYPARVTISANVSQATRAHLLLTTGDGFNQFSGRTIGRVVAYCSGAPLPIADLQLGRDVREWHVADNVVSSASRAREVWSGAIRDAPAYSGHIDMLSLDLPDACQSGALTALEVIDSSAETVGSLDPGLNLTGVTVEHLQ